MNTISHLYHQLREAAIFSKDKVDYQSIRPNQGPELDYLDKLQPLARYVLKNYRKEMEESIQVPLNLVNRIQRGEAHSQLDLKNQNILEQIGEIRRDFAAKNLDSFSFMPESIQGLYKGTAITFLLNELKKYKAQRGLTKAEKAEVQKAICALSNAYQIELDLAVIHFLLDEKTGADTQHLTNHEQALPILKALSEHFSSKLAVLKPGEQLLLPGGTIDHRMMYSFIYTGEKEGKPIFTMKIFNSGEGAISKNWLSWLNPWAKFQTYVIKGIPLDHLIQAEANKESVIYELLSKTVGIGFKSSSLFLIGWIINTFKTLTNISSIYRLIHVQILKKGAIVDKNAMEHKPQNQGSCSRKAYNYVLKEDFFIS